MKEKEEEQAGVNKELACVARNLEVRRLSGPLVSLDGGRLVRIVIVRRMQRGLTTLSIPPHCEEGEACRWVCRPITDGS